MYVCSLIYMTWVIFFIFSDEEDLDEEVCIILLVCTAIDDFLHAMLHEIDLDMTVGFNKIITCTTLACKL